MEELGNLSHHTEIDQASSETGRAGKMMLVRGMWLQKDAEKHALPS